MRMTSLIAAMSLTALVACTKLSDDRADSAHLADSLKAAPPAPSTPTAAMPLTDANIVALLDEANMADSASGTLATTKGTKADVRAFGVLMMRDHHALRVAGLDLANKLNLTPTPPANDSLPGKVKTAQDHLASMDKGPAWDKAYIDGEVAAHQTVLGLIDTAQAAAQAQELKALLTKARPTVEMHLKRAQEIQSKLGADTTKKT